MRYSWLDRQLLSAVRGMAGPIPVRLVLGPKSDAPQNDAPKSEGPQSETPDASFEESLSPATAPLIRIKDRGALLAILRNPTISFGDLYSSGDIEVEGDLVRLIEQLYMIPNTTARRMMSRMVSWMPSNSRRASRRNIHHHYDLSNDFYQWWLDSQMVYTCAYFPRPDATLEEAQTAKLDLVCRKLWLRPGETVVEAGCGWGALALHMARHYGVRVKAFNISREQILFARERAQREGLASQVEFCEDDYRSISGASDVFVSVGMLEHVGRSHHQDLGRVMHRVIGDQGRGLLHFIGRNFPRPLNAWIRKRVFPGGYPPVLGEVMDLLEPHNFAVLDVENLRGHYAKTLECWLSRFERSYDRVADRFGNTFARMWRLYLAGSTAAFRSGTLQLFQVVFAGNACDPRPWTREYLYNNSNDSKGRDAEWTHAMS
jgi:cyclopropane-fatty-acyl-phospholipid synthase